MNNQRSCDSTVQTNTDTKVRQESVRHRVRTWALPYLMVLIGCMGLAVTQSYAQTIPDTGGENDIDPNSLNNQNDLAGSSINGNTFTFAWDEVVLSGANSSDTCTYFLEPDSSATAVCYSVQYEDDGTITPGFPTWETFTCTAAQYGNSKCTGNQPTSTEYVSTCTTPVSVTPFFPGDDNNDLEASCTITNIDGSPPTDLQYINTCSKPSASPSSNSNDCILSESVDPAFLSLEKVVSDGTATDSDFTLTATNSDDATQSISGAGSIATTPVNSGSWALTETSTLIDDGNYQLVDIVCTDSLGSDVPVTGDPLTVTLAELTTVNCVYTNEVAFVEDPQVQIEKTPEGQTVDIGGTASFVLTITNTGNVPLQGLEESDDTCTTGTTFLGGDVNNDDILDLDEIWRYTCQTEDVQEGFTNTADILAQSTVSGDVVTDTDTAVVFVRALSIDKQLTNASSDPVVEGTTLEYTITASNDGDTVLTNVEVSDSNITPASFTCVNLAPQATCVLTGTYVVTADDVIAGAVDNTATVDSDQTNPITDTLTVPVAASPGLSLQKALSSGNNPAAEGDVLEYTIIAMNSGNTVLTDVVVSDSLITPETITCASVAIDASCILVGEYTVQASDVVNGSVDNTATASTDGFLEEAFLQVPTVGSPALGIVKALTAGNNPAAEGDVLTYTVTATNNGNIVLTDVEVSDNTITPNSETCDTLASGATCVLTGTYTVQASDVTNGSVVNIATADSNETSEVTDTVTVTTSGTPGLGIEKTLRSGPNPATLGATLSYELTATNTGNVSLTNVVLSDDMITPDTATCGTVAPGATCTLIGTYQVTQADIAAGSILNTATANSDQTPEEETELSISTEIGTAKIGNLLWNDFNNNGIRDAGEPGLPGQTVELYDCSGNLLLTETTNGDGSYFFRDLPLGGYQVRVVPIPGASLSPADVGSNDNIDSDFDPVSGLSPCITLSTPGEFNLTVDAGLNFGDGPPTLSVADLTVNEDDGTANVTVFLSAPATQDVTFRAFTQSGSATGGTDFFGFGGQSAINPIVIPAGSTSVTVPVTIIDDAIQDEPNRDFRLRIEPAPGAPINAVIADPIGVVTIVDDDTSGGGGGGNCVANPDISILDVTANEADGGGSAVISLDQCSTTDVNVRVFTRIGSAEPPSAGGTDPDYFGFTQNITIPAGSSTGTVSFTLINDNISEALETFELRMLCNASCGATIVDGTAVVSINDDDSGGGGGFEACPADHWKQSSNFLTDWPLNTQVNGEFLRMGKPFLNVFGVTYANPDLDLLRSLRRTGGGNQALMREGVAAMLNAASTAVNFPLTIQDVLTAVANGDTATLQNANNGGTCPL